MCTNVNLSIGVFRIFWRAPFERYRATGLPHESNRGTNYPGEDQAQLPCHFRRPWPWCVVQAVVMSGRVSLMLHYRVSDIRPQLGRRETKGSEKRLWRGIQILSHVIPRVSRVFEV